MLFRLPDGLFRSLGSARPRWEGRSRRSSRDAALAGPGRSMAVSHLPHVIDVSLSTEGVFGGGVPTGLGRT